MNWAAVSFDWNHLRAFLATVEEGSLSAAARALGQAQPTLSRQIAALETALDVVLFERVGRGLVLAPAGRDLLAHVRAMGEAAGRVSLAAAGRAQAVEGRVSITASEVVSAYVLPGVLKRLRAAAPGIAIDVVASDQMRDLQRREADIALRNTRPEQPELIARRVSDGAGGLYAARAYLSARGHPRRPEELAGHDFIGFQPLETYVSEMNRLGYPLQEAQVRVMSASGIVAWEAVRAGLGIGPMSRDVAGLFPEVVPLLPEVTVPVPVWLTCHRELHASRRIRLVYDLLAEALASRDSSSR
jgi:DNA-binding transcriptional LysR family regulator